MTQDDYVWVAIRVAGLYLLLQAILALLGAISNAYWLAFILEEPDQRQRELGRLGGNIFELIALGWVGRYLFIDGERLFAWANRRRKS